MLNRFIVIALLSSVSLLYGQPDGSALIEEELELQDQGRYKEVIAKYNKVLLSDGNNL
ncbi:hypothetical protein N9502_01060 [Vicingaceae bacterium]|nr:hypothetical protein [Vicingaceae bacterium]